MEFFKHISSHVSKWLTKQRGKRLLRNVSLHDKVILGKAIVLSNKPYCNTIVEKFTQCGSNQRLFIADINDQKDLDYVAHLANHYREIRFVIAPRIISEERLNNIRMYFRGNSLLYSEYDEVTDFRNTQILIIDYLGDLPLLYRYGTWAYVGGGLKEIFAPISFGLPVACGHKFCNTSILQLLIEQKICSIVHSAKEISQWFEDLRDNDSLLEQIRNKAKAFVSQNTTN